MTRYRSLVREYLRSPREETRYAAYLLGRSLDGTMAPRDLFVLHSQAVLDLLPTSGHGAVSLRTPLSLIHQARDLLDELYAGWSMTTGRPIE